MEEDVIARINMQTIMVLKIQMYRMIKKSIYKIQIMMIMYLNHIYIKVKNNPHKFIK